MNGKGPPLRHPVKIIGYAPRNSILDPEVLAYYGDYKIGREIPLGDFEHELEQGYLPSGLLVKIENGPVAIVTGPPNDLWVKII